MLGQHLPRGAQPSGQSSSAPSDMLFHNGTIMTTTVVTPIFWGKSWATYTGDKISGMTAWYEGVGSTNYSATNDEYTGTNGQVTNNVTYAGTTVIDAGSSLLRAPKTSDILNEVCKVIKTPVANGYYPVYTDLPRGHAGYCAWHSYSTCGGTPVQFGFFFKLDGDPGCDPQDTSGLHSQGLAAIANVSGHELSEMMTDPRNGGWYDSSGSENGDKCAWTFSTNAVKAGAANITFSNGSVWKIQGNFSNHANDNHLGYDGNGCIDGNQ